MRRVETGAYYILVQAMGLQFVNLNAETNAINTTSCPHDATLFTSSLAAHDLADRIVNSMQGTKVSVMSTRTHAPNAVCGPLPKKIIGLS